MTQQFFTYSEIIDIPGKINFPFFHQKRLSWLFSLKEVKPFPDHKRTKLLAFDN